MPTTLVEQYLKRLRLPTIAKCYERLATEAAANKAGFADYLCCLLEQEIEAREGSTRKRRISEAKFPMLKTLDSFDFDEIPGLDKSLVLKLANDRIFLRKKTSYLSAVREQGRPILESR